MKHVWTCDQRSRYLTAALSTASGIAFVGDLDRYFRAVDVKIGEILWQARLGTSVQGFPVTLTAAGRQYIAVTTGLGGRSPRNVPRIIEPDAHHPQNAVSQRKHAVSSRVELGILVYGLRGYRTPPPLC
jgi:alcohol dehydrogenase (cytochrome c)